MSRAQHTEVSSPLSLFPFIGVLLSTMGALLVVLIAVSRSARDSAVREVAAEEAATSAGAVEDARQKIEHVADYVAQLNAVRAEAEERLRDDQMRLSHVEDHMRRLKEQVGSLRQIAQELLFVEGKHVDDRKQAEKAAERLGQLIASTRAEIDSMKEEARKKKRSYAIIPYDGPHGTKRRPIYIECCKDEVILQPEGIRLTPDDFQEPLGAGNPLAAALRAAREYIVREDAGMTGSKEAEPYPLILVRPEGIIAYYKVREAIESWDAAFGYELIDNDWSLEFPPANPLLAEIEQYAVANSRTRQQLLIAAAPRAYGNRRMSGGSQFEDEELRGGDEFGGGPAGGVDAGGDRDSGSAGGGLPGSYGVDVAENGKSGEFFSEGVPQTAAGGANSTGDASQRSGEIGDEIHDGVVGFPGGASGTIAGGSNGQAGGGSTSGSTGASTGTQGGATGGPQQAGTSTTIIAGPAESNGMSGFGAPPPLPPSATGGSVADGFGEANLAGANRATHGAGPHAASTQASRSGSAAGAEPASLAMQMNKPRHSSPHARGQNWAIQDKPPTAVSVRRPIRVVVRSDRLSIPPDPSRAGSVRAGKEIQLAGSTDESLDEFVVAVQDRVHEWGIGGDQMYWQPVLVLSIEPNGQSRAEDLERLLRNSGIDIEYDTMAARPQEAKFNATR